MNSIYEKDKRRYRDKKDPALRFIKRIRRCQSSNNKLKIFVNKLLIYPFKYIHGIEMSVNTEIGEGFYLGHPYGINNNPKAVIGKNVNIHKGVTLGQENRGKRKGAPVIGNNVWIGINSTVVGNVRIGNDVLIAANSFVNRDVPDHSIVFGNPCIIKPTNNATEGYINFFD